MTEPAARGTLGTVRNAVLLLALLSEGQAYQQLTDLAERSGLSVPTVHRLLRSLVLAGMVEQDPSSSRYGLGAELVRLAQRYLSRLPIVGALSPYLIPLRDSVGQTVHVAVLARGHVVYVDRVDGSDDGLYRENHRTQPALETAAGRVLAVRADDETWNTALAAAAEPLRTTAKAGRHNWSLATHLVSLDNEPAEAGEVAVPVSDKTGRTVAALAATLPPTPTDAQITEIATHLSRTARAVGKALNQG